MKRYRINRVYGQHIDPQIEAWAPTIHEANQWILDRIRRAGKVGLRLRPLDFDVIDTWEAP